MDEEIVAEATKAVARPDPILERMRLDDVPLACVDPHDGSERDSAVAAVRSPAGGWTLHVAVADVASYVEADGPLDAEAGKAAATCRHPEHTLTIRMLPEVLIEAASLTPGKASRVLWTRLEVEPHGAVRASRVMIPAVAEDVTVFDARDVHPHEALTELLACARAMREYRTATRQPLAFHDRGEPVFERDRQGTPIGWTLRHEGAVDLAVKEATIAADRAAATWLFEAGAGAATIARAQRAPSLRHWKELWRFLGVSRVSEHAVPRSAVRKLMEQGERETLAMSRILPSARYVRLDGDTAHFTLGEDRYVHSTSPLRRYADLTVQRTAHAVHRGKRPPAFDAERIETINTNTNVVAVVEHDVVEQQWLAAAFKRKGSAVVERGTVIGIEEFAVLVRPHGYEPLEGRVDIDWLNGDGRAYARTPWSVVGQVAGHRVAWHLGDTVAVEVHECDTGRIELKPAGASRPVEATEPAQPRIFTYGEVEPTRR